MFGEFSNAAYIDRSVISRSRFLIILVAIPSVCCLTINYGFGGKIRDLPIGIVNNEVSQHQECQMYQSTGCFWNKTSCRFLDEFDEVTTKKVWVADQEKFTYFVTKIRSRRDFFVFHEDFLAFISSSKFEPFQLDIILTTWYVNTFIP